MEQEKQYKTWDGKNWDGRLFRDEQKKYTVYLPKYGITVKTGLTDAREISYQTEIKALKQSRDMYFALGRLGESRRDFTEGIFKQAAKATGNFVVSSSANLYGWGKDWLWKGYNEHKKGSAERQKFTEMLNKEYQPSYTYEPLKDAQERYNSAIEKVKNSEEYKQFVADNEKKFAESEKSRQEWNLRQRKDLDDFIQKSGLDKNHFDGFTYDLVGGGASAVAALAVGVITKSPAAVAAVFGASAGHEYYTEALAAGLNGNKAMAVGYGAGALEGFLELFGAEGLYRAAVRAKPFKHSINAIIRNARIKLKKQGLKKMGLDMGTAALQGAAVEGSEEFVQDISTAAIMNAAGVRNDEARQVIIDAFYSAALGAITGGALAGGGRGGIRMLAYMQKQSIANKLEQAGFDKENAKEIAAEIIDKGYSKQTTDAFIKFAESENSPLTYPNGDKEAAAKRFGEQVKELADPAKRAAAAKEIWDIYDKVKADALNAGLPAMWAEFAANSAKNIAAQYSSYLDIMPKEWYEKNKITFINSMKTNWENAGKPQRVSYKDGEKVMTDQTLARQALGGKERFNQPLLNTVDTTQQVNVVDLSSFKFDNIKPVKDQINDKLKELLQKSPLSTATKNIFADVLNKKISHIQNSSKYIFLLQHKDNKKRHDKNVFNLDNLMQNAVLVAIAPNVKKQNKPNVENYYYFYVPVRYGNDVFVVQIAAEENVNEVGIDPKTVHIYDVLEIKKVRSGNLANDISKNKSSLPNNISIEDLLTNVKDYQKQDYILKPVINVNGKQLGTRNSDGRQIAHTPQDIANFWNWFGDSKVVDEQGRPLVVYHGSPASEKFNVFDKTKIGQRDEGDFGKLFYFTPDADYAKSYALTTGVNTFYSDRNVKNGQVYPVYIKMDNPRYVSKLDSGTIDEEKLKGYDGIILYESFDLRNDPKELERIKKEITNESYLVRDFEDNIIGYRKMVEVGVKEPAQIKSVYNRGTFDFNDSNIFFQRAYAGSPAKFDKFSLDAIGSGEGAAAHGWGLYFSKNKKTAINYRTLKSDNIYYKGRNIEELRQELEREKEYDKAALIEDFMLKMDSEELKKSEHSEENLSWFKKEIEPHIKQDGQLSEVEIPEDDVLLDEQKRFDEQPKNVQEGIFALAEDYEVLSQLTNQDNWGRITGREIYEKLSAELAVADGEIEQDERGAYTHNKDYYNRQTSILLNKYGIKGITYEGREDGRCYVIFDDKAISLIETYYQRQDNQQPVDLTAEFANIKGLTAQNAQQLIEQELNKLIGKPLDTATPPLQIQITSGNKVYIKRPNVPLKGGQLVRHQAVLSALEKVVNKAVKTDKDGTVDLTHNTSKRTLTHKAGVDKYVYFKAPVQAEITDENGQKSTVYFEVELAAEQVKGQGPNLLDLYNVRVKKSSPHTHLSAFAGNTNSITNNGQNDNSFNQDDVIGARGYVEFSTQGAFMHLLENADPSTILHETSGHIQLRNMEQMRDLAETQGATEEFWDIWQGLEKWLGKAQRIENPDGTVKYRFTTEQQEMFAEGMEKMYIAGKAPTTALQKIFEYFKQMLSTMYEEAREWLDLRPEVEQLFEKILAGPQVENADSKLYKGRAKDIKAVAEKARNGESATINGMGIKEVKALLKQLSKRRPALPKDDLYTVLKRKGADYDNAAQIDKEAYENAGIKNKKDGIGDKLAQFLYNEGFLAEGYGETYEEQRKLDETAADMINRALDGEKIYKLDDQEKVAQIENFDANMQTIREAFGNNVEQAEQTLRAIEDLQAQGYRVIGNSDIEYAEKETGKLLSFAEKEREFKAKIEELTKDKEELANIAQRRLIEIGRTATSAREEGYKEAIKDAQDEKTVKDLLAIEREAYKNALDARRVKRALLEELNKRELENKQEMLKELSEAKTNEEIYKAAQKLMGVLYRAYEQSEAGKAEKAKTDIPKTNWGLVKLNAVKKFKEIAQKATVEIEQARALDKEASVMRAKGQKPDQNKQAQIDNARNKILKGYGLKYAKALKEAFYAVPHIDNVWLDKQANYLGAEYARGHNILGAELDNMIERAKKRQSENYKKYIAAKIEKMISAGYKVKDGQKQKGKYDYLTNKLFEDLKNIGTMDRTFAKKELEKREKIAHNAPSPAEAVLQVLGLEGDADNIDAGLVDNMKLENMYLTFKAGKMNKEEMSAQKEYFQAEGLPDTIGTDEWYYVSAELLGQFYKELNERRQAALEGRLAKSLKRALKEQQEREAFGAAVKKNAKAGFLTKGYLSLVANWESYLNTVANEEAKEKYSLLLEEAKAETRVHQKMGEIIRAASNALNTNNAEDVKKWFDSLDDKVITVKNRIESKRKALQDNDVYIRSKIEMMEQFRNLLAGKNEVVLKNALTLREGQRRGDFNVKVVYDRADGGLKKIYDGGGIEAVMRAVSLIPKGFIDEYSQAAKKYKDDDVILLKNSNDFSAVLKYNEVGGKGTYTLIDFVKYDKDGKQIAGYGLDEVEQNKTVKTLTKTEFENGVRNLSKADKSKVVKIAFAPVSEKLTQLAKRYNLDITGYVHDIENSAITHIDDKHGKVNLEAKRGQIAITEKDLFNIPDIINNPDFIAFGAKDENGKDLITYVKNMPDGSTFFIEEVRTGKKTLSTKSMRKYKGETASGSIAKRISNAHKTNLSNIIVIEKSDFVNVADDEGINAWIEKEKENAVVSAPLRRGQALKNNRDVISGHSPINSLADILKNANTQKETFFQGKEENAVNGTDTINAQKETDVNSKEIEQEIKRAAVNAASNQLNPFIDTIYAPVEQELTKGQIIDIYNTCKNDVGYSRYLNQYGLDQLTEMFALLTKQEKDIADMWQKTVEGGYDEVNKVFVSQYGLDMGKPENYWPFSVDRIESEIDMLASNYREAGRPGMTKSRTAGTLVEMLPQNPVEKLYRHYNTAMKYVETAEKVGWLRRVLRHSTIKKAIKEQFGEDAMQTMYELLDNSTLGANTRKAKHYQDSIMNWLTNNYVKAAIALKPSITLKQLISVVNYSENMPAGEWAKGFANAVVHPKETIDFMMDDPYLKTRFENGSQNEALMRALAKDFGKNKTVKQLNSWSNMLAINVRLGDIGAIIFGGKPYIDYLMKEKGMSKEDAFKQFRLDTLRSQQASMRSALSRLQAAEMNWLMRALFAFKNTGNQYVRKCADAIISYKRGEIDAKQLAKTLAIYGVINQYLYVALGSLGLFAAAGAGFDDDDKNKQMWAEFMQWPAQNFGFLPILDDAINQASYRLINLALDGKAGPVRNPETPILKDIYGAVRTLQKDDLAFEDVINALAPVAQTATGLPVNYGVNAVSSAYDLYKGDLMKTALILGGWSRKRAESVAE